MASASKKPSAADFLPERISLSALRRAAQTCRGCELFQRATQTVFGQGAAKARIVFLGEMPGDREDREGKPFVGPAGRLFDDILREAGIDLKETYVTNAVKHFRWEERGKRRLHKRPGRGHVEACRPWLVAELEVIEPEMIVCLGATAAQALMGPKFRLTQVRGELLPCDWAPWLMATYHPSAILRAPDKSAADRMRSELLQDFRRVRKEITRAS
jgi:uracil-DNA glycosylase family protein